MDTAAALARLVAVVRRLAAEKRAELDKHKENHADIARPDFLWHYLLQSSTTTPIWRFAARKVRSGQQKRDSTHPIAVKSVVNLNLQKNHMPIHDSK